MHTMTASRESIRFGCGSASHRRNLRLVCSDIARGIGMGIRTFEIAVEIPDGTEGEALEKSRQEAITMWWQRVRPIGQVMKAPTANELTIPRRAWEVAGLVNYPDQQEVTTR